jgi:hypothetical protein
MILEFNMELLPSKSRIQERFEVWEEGKRKERHRSSEATRQEREHLHQFMQEEAEASTL